MIPHELIRETADRSWSLRLVDEIARGASSELKDIYETLGELGDPRVLKPLTALMENRELPVPVRMSASDALCSMQTEDTVSERLSWWSSGDPVLRRHALRTAEGTESDLVEKIAREPEHEFHPEAIEAIRFWDNVRFQDIMIEALKHPNTQVRAKAASGCLWEEPWRAEKRLLQCAGDSDKELVDAALYTLEWYTSKSVLLGLDKLSREGPVQYREQYLESFDAVLHSMLSEMKSSAADCERWLSDWIKPVSLFFDLGRVCTPDFEKANCSAGNCSEPVSEIKAQGEGAVKNEEIYSQWDCKTIISECEQADGLWRRKLDHLRCSANWLSFGEADRRVLAGYLCRHADAEVRNICCTALSLWGMTESLVGLLDDPAWGVARSAAYNMIKLPRDEALAPVLWKLFKGRRATGSYAREIFDSFLAHAPEPELDDLLIDMVIGEDREAFIVAALYELSRRNNVKALNSLMWLLHREPLVSWQVHAGFVGACSCHDELRPDVSHLREVDDLKLQIQIAELLSTTW